MIYLTYNDPPSGIYFSQVTDVCNFLNRELNASVRLISFISVRNFFSNRSKIKKEFPAAFVLPMFPTIRFWKFNIFFLFFLLLFIPDKKVIARGPFAAGLCLMLKRIGFFQKVIFDARGAYTAELNEYNVTDDEKVKRDIFQIEKNAVLNSDFRISVSNALIDYWKEKFGYSGNEHVVIPCTLNSKYFNVFPDLKIINEKRKDLGFADEEIVLAYSGSNAGWQSLEMVDDFLYRQMKSNARIKILFLLKFLPENMKIKKEFGDRIVCKWLKEDEVAEMLSICDYGILIREKSVTNKVSSPVKFAEYLAAGLKILISDGVGDYSEFVLKHNCGMLCDRNENIILNKIQYEEKIKIARLAIENFSKSNFINQYRQVLSIRQL